MKIIVEGSPVERPYIGKCGHSSHYDYFADSGCGCVFRCTLDQTRQGPRVGPSYARSFMRVCSCPNCGTEVGMTDDANDELMRQHPE